jgi:hypothetical protein
LKDTNTQMIKSNPNVNHSINQDQLNPHRSKLNLETTLVVPNNPNNGGGNGWGQQTQSAMNSY